MMKRFTRLARIVSEWAGSPYAFIAGLVLISGWALLGPFYGWSEAHSLVINSITTVITFLMVFLIQASQNRSERAIQTKLDELLCSVEQADNRLIDIEHDEDEAMEAARRNVAARKDA